MSWAGVPRRVLVDLDSAFKGDFLQIMNERSVLVRCAAGQAHWQNGLAERHGGAWKEIFKKVVEDHSILNNEVHKAAAATSAPKTSSGTGAGPPDSGCSGLR